MSYHNTSSSTTQSRVNAQGEMAPAGYHYMPDGSLMLDTEHVEQSDIKTIKSFNLDTSDLKASTTTRGFLIVGDEGAEFSLEITNEDSPKKYYNFITDTFSETKASLDKTLGSSSYRGSITFPTVGDDDQYDIFLHARGNTKHASYVESRFADGSIDINNSIGSNSLLMQKVIYQYTDLTLTISTISPSGTIETASQVNSEITTLSRNNKRASAAFSISCAVSTATKSYAIKKQPSDEDILVYKSITQRTEPETLPGEDIYPTVTTAADATSEGGTTVNGSSSGTTVTTHVVSNTIAEVGDRVLGNSALSASVVTVETVTEGSGKTFTISESVSIADDLPLSFSNRMHYQWPVSDADGITFGASLLPDTNVTANSKVTEYEDAVTIFADTEFEEKIIKDGRQAIDLKQKTPTISKGIITAQEGSITFDKQQKYALLGATLRIGATGVDGISSLYGYDIKFTDLAIALTPVTATTTAAVNNSTSVAVSSRAGILNGSTVSGIGIDSSVASPTVSSGATSQSTAGTVVLSAAQNLENGITLAFDGAGTVATITGNIEVVKAGTANKTIYFDMDKLLSIA